MYCIDCGKDVSKEGYCHNHRCVDCCIKWQELEISYYKKLHEDKD